MQAGDRRPKSWVENTELVFQPRHHAGRLLKDDRKQIVSQFFEPVSSVGSLSDSTNAISMPTMWYDTVEISDFERQIVGQQDTTADAPELIRNLSEFPIDDVEVKEVQRECRTVNSVKLEEENVDSHVINCFNSFTDDWSVYTRKYAHLGSGTLAYNEEKSSVSIKALPKQLYEGEFVEETNEVSPGADPEGGARGSWSSNQDMKNSQSDPMLESVLEGNPQEEVDSLNRERRNKDRLPSLFALYHPPTQSTTSIQQSAVGGPGDDSDFPIEKRHVPPAPEEHLGYRLLVKCLNLEMDVEIEPIFACVALYDTKYKKKISENFYFDLNSEAMNKLIKNDGVPPSIPTLARSAIFSLTSPSKDVFIVIRLEKVLQQGEIVNCAEPYMKDATDKVREKAKQSSKWFCERLGKYRMPFAWTAIHLMNIVGSATNLKPMQETTSSAFSGQNAEEGKSSGSLDSNMQKRSLKHTVSGQQDLSETQQQMLTTFKPVTLTVSSVFKQESDKLKDEDLFKFLVDLKRPSSMLKKLKLIPALLKLDVSPCPPNFPYCITPDLHRLKPYPDQRGRPSREIKEFSPKEVYVPNLTYCNLMYVYPLNVNFTNRQGHVRNIAVKVQLLCGEEANSVLPAIFGKSNCADFTTEAYTAITYHIKNPDYYEEIKIKLPAKITEKHHLLFTFYHISCQKKQDLTPIETIVGHTWMPLLHNGHLHVGDLSLPVSMDKLPSNYTLLSPESNIPGVKWVDGRKPVFSLSVKCISTVHTMDRHLDSFFTVCNVIDKGAIGRTEDVEKRLANCMRDVAKDAKLEPLVHFLHVILNKFVQLLVRPPVINGHVINLGTTCFESLALLSVRLHQSLEFDVNEHGQSNLLHSYASYVFNPNTLLSQTESEGTETLGALGGSHYATMTRPVQRTRPAMSPATFHLSSSNPDLTTPPATPDEPPPDDPARFLRFSSSRASLMEQPSTTKNLESTGVRSITRKVFHEELALLWVVSTAHIREKSFKHPWFFFDLMTKSMVQNLKLTDGFEMTRSMRFPARYVDDLTRLIHMVTTEIINSYSKDYDFAERLNLSLAFFFNDLLSIMDRGFVFSLLQTYAQQMGMRIYSLQSPASLLNLRLTLIRVVASHEHYITMNLPFAMAPSPSSPTPSVASTTSSIISSGTTHISSQYELSDAFIQRHYLAGIILSDIQTTIDMIETASVTGSQLYAVTTLRNLMISHDMDPRLKENPVVKEKIAALYMPLMLIAIKALPYLYQFSSDASGDSGDPGIISQSVANAIATASPMVLSRTTSQHVPLNSGILSAECTRNLLLCVSWLIKNISKQTIRHLFSGLSTLHTNSLLDLLYLSISCFEYKVPRSSRLTRSDSSRSSVSRKKDKMSRLEDAILGGAASARREMLMRRRNEKGGSTSMPRDFERGLRWHKDRTEWKQDKGLGDKNSEDNAVANANFAAESTLIVLDTLEMILETASEMGSVPAILSSCLRTLLHCVGTNQSTKVYDNIFATQRSIVAKFPELVFEEEVEQLPDLCLCLLQRCSSSVSSIRSQAAASLYLLMRHNFSIGNSFARVKMQITTSLSSLVGMSALENFDEEYLRRSLQTVLTYAKTDKDMKSTSFPEQVQDMIFNFHMILSDTVKMKEHKEDPEMLIDLMYRIAKGYQNSPDLRMTWLQNMAKQHSERKNHAESGMCILHSAALVAEYIGMIEETSYLPIGCVDFQHISINILEESAVSDDVVSPHEDEVCTEKYFSTLGLVGLLEQAAYAFDLAGLYEVTNKLYKLLIPVYEEFHEYKKLSDIHTKLSNCFTKISSQVGKRMFGTYFRVGFYGSLFGDLNGEQFIYKEPSITKLPEISYRLETFYGQCFGPSNVEVLKDSNQVETSKLDPSKAYIQITYVDPFFHKWEENRRTTYFERNFNINTFVYATPYTLDGKAHGSIKDQYKRKVFLQVSQTFPYVRTRLSVVKKWETVLTPLETACEDVQRKTTQLLLAAEQQETDVRMLQVNLQGSLLTTVNQGPMEVAQTFLTSIPEDSKMWVPYNRLRLAFRKFLYACSVALKKNKQLIGPDQKEYQRELERNYNRMTDELKPMINNLRVMQLIRDATPEQLDL
uniref:dedicator of cytokinesis protein 7-like n=1 Tax=Styela clava TaxID=7725 RepID=UPI0019393245|nr:dedicator of cytokinesis protein 7-like [Styela clava]